MKTAKISFLDVYNIIGEISLSRSRVSDNLFTARANKPETMAWPACRHAPTIDVIETFKITCQIRCILYRWRKQSPQPARGRHVRVVSVNQGQHNIRVLCFVAPTTSYNDLVADRSAAAN